MGLDASRIALLIVATASIQVRAGPARGIVGRRCPFASHRRACRHANRPAAGPHARVGRVSYPGGF
jgi:hypothetical protein